MSKKVLKLNVQGSDITIITDTENEENDYICLTDVANKFGDTRIIDNWLRNRSTIEFLGFWESLHNAQDFNSIEFEGIKNEAGSNRFVMSVKKWVNKTNAIGIHAKTGKYNSGTYAHKDIAMAFCSWISPEFQLFIIKEFQRLKKEEAERNNELKDWTEHRWLSKVNYKVQTDAIKTALLPSLNLPKHKEGSVYADEGDMLNLIVFGVRASKWEELNPKNPKIRDVASKKALTIIANLESTNGNMLDKKIPKQEREKDLIEQCKKQKQTFGILSNADLYRHDLFTKINIPNIDNLELERQAPTEFVSAIDKIIKKKD